MRSLRSIESFINFLLLKLTQATVFIYAGSYDLVTSPAASLILDKSVALIAPSLIGSSYFFPIDHNKYIASFS